MIGTEISASKRADPRLDDVSLLIQMEERLSRESGADSMNEETFGDCSEAWTFEKALAANEKLWETELSPSTTSGSQSHSECQSCGSESSTPRATAVEVNPWMLQTSTLRAEAPAFHVWRAEAPEFYPGWAW
jgi:hypothetical protein